MAVNNFLVALVYEDQFICFKSLAGTLALPSPMGTCNSNNKSFNNIKFKL